MYDVLGYIALSISVFALSRKEVKHMRQWHFLSSFIYVFYGLFIAAYPVVVGAGFYCLIHAWFLLKKP